MVPSSPRPRVADLHLRVFGRSLHPDWFAVKSHRRLVQDGWEADLRIIDGGHAVHWRSDRFRLTEVLSGPATTLPAPGLLLQSNIRHERTSSLQPGGGLEYHVSFEVERCDLEVFDHLCDEAALDGSRQALRHSFSSANRMAPPAWSLIHYEARAKGLSVHTFHSFPDERAIVRTHSLFESRLALPAR